LPRYSHTWDVQKALNYLDALGDNQTLSLKQLSWKVTMLIALSRPSRSANLSKLDISKRVYKPDGVCFYPNTLAKQSRSTLQISNFFFPSLPGGSRLCLVLTLKEYKSRTQPLRGRETNLLIAIIKPHKAVSSSTVARWWKPQALTLQYLVPTLLEEPPLQQLLQWGCQPLTFSKLQAESAFLL